MSFARMHNDYLDPDRHLWMDGDDGYCAQCGDDLPANPEEDTPAWDGFCSQDCLRLDDINLRRRKRGKSALDWHQGIYHGMWILLRRELNSDPARWPDRLNQMCRFDTTLVLAPPGRITIRGRIPGVAGSTCERTLAWPFTKDDLWQTVNTVEGLVDDAWHRTQGCPACARAQGRDYATEAGDIPVLLLCCECMGEGRALPDTDT